MYCIASLYNKAKPTIIAIARIISIHNISTALCHSILNDNYKINVFKFYLVLGNYSIVMITMMINQV